MSKLTIQQFRDRFPNDDACLDHIFNLKYAVHQKCEGCKAPFNYKRVKDRKAYQCSKCSHQVYPMADTIFFKSTTPLTYWFYAIYLHSVCKNGVAAKELERQLSVCYKTALRMAHQIKILMSEKNIEIFTGETIIDESYVGGLASNKHISKRGEVKSGYSGKTAVFGIINKEGTKAYTKVMPVTDINGAVLKPLIRSLVETGSTIVTDYFGGYEHLHRNYTHIRVNHSSNEYVRDGHSTNRCENWWSSIKRQLKGTHISVSVKHLSKYISENSFRYINRNNQEQMFDLILNRIV